MIPSFAVAASLIGLATANPFAQPITNPPFESNLFPKRAACDGNTATTRSEWCDYSIDTDYYTEYVDTGVVREYWVCRLLKLNSSSRVPGRPHYTNPAHSSI